MQKAFHSDSAAAQVGTPLLKTGEIFTENLINSHGNAAVGGSAWGDEMNLFCVKKVKLYMRICEKERWCSDTFQTVIPENHPVESPS